MSTPAIIMFQRSLALHKFPYTEMLGDGDEKAYAKLLKDNQYPGHETNKVECVSRVTKMMGTALWNLVEKRKAQKLPSGESGKLKDEYIKSLTNYHGRAIKDNAGDLTSMENAVWALFFHTISSDVDLHHSRCPPGEVIL
ncbi:hypothetical protein BaRGS_00035770 [Batillaria attramentaria]|uniref:Mutator-like transposase domain-containing protein n=1 Tax=Batillaria attramentaria TaxID=370345 RepID=A0ABD0JDK6_9CAEN